MLAEKPARGVLLSLERKMEESQPRMSTTGEFMSRMEGDTQTRRREKFINELSANAPATRSQAYTARMQATMS